jgi:hypothetical protein
MKNNPAAYPHKFKTYGRDNTPDPTAEALNAKILPLTDPLSSLEKVLSMKVFGCPAPYLLPKSAMGDKDILPGFTLNPASSFSSTKLFFSYEINLSSI